MPSTQPPNPTLSLSTRVKLWLESNNDPALLDTGPKDSLQRELRDWITCRRRCNANIAALHKQYLSHAAEFVRNLAQDAARMDRKRERHGAGMRHRRRPFMSRKDKMKGMRLLGAFRKGLTRVDRLRERISLEERVLQPQAVFLCQSLQTRHEVEVALTGQGTVDVVGALVALDHPGIGPKTVDELNDELSRRERDAEWDQLKVKSAEALKLLNELRLAGEQ